MAEAAPKEDQESMEEILQSIKRIMDDSTNTEQPPAPVSEAGASEAGASETDVFDLTNVVKDDISMNETLPPDPIQADPEPEIKAPVKEPYREPVSARNSSEDEEATLLSKQAADAAATAFRQIVDSSQKDLSIPNIPSPQFRGGNTIEDLVLETLRPMMKEWLDENLPIIVQKIVEKEVKRIVTFHHD